MDWVAARTTAITGLVAGSAAGIYIVLPSTVRTEFTDPTLVRVRGIFAWGHPTTTATGTGAVGIIPWRDINDTVPGAAEMPFPHADGAMDWLYHRWFAWAESAGVNRVTEFEIDSRAMRRLGNDQGVLLIASNSPESTGTVVFNVATRCLLKDG